MLNLINLTQARNNLSRLIDEVVLKKSHLFLFAKDYLKINLHPMRIGFDL